MGFASRLLAICSLLVGASSADESLLETSRWRFFSDPKEIASLYINDLIQEVSGYVWLATDRGLVRHDGIQFVLQDVPDVPKDARYRRLLEAADGTVWIGTSAGLAKYIAHEWQYPIRSGNVTALTESADGAIWVGISPPDESEIRDQDIVAPAGAAKVAIRIYEHRRWREFIPSDRTFPAAPIRLLYGDQVGGVWAVFGSDRRSSGVFRFYRGVWHNMGQAIGLGNVGILSLAQTRDGAYWFGTFGRGVWRWQNDRLETFADRGPGVAFTAASLLPMPDGSLWAVGAPAGTVYQHVDGLWKEYPVRQVGLGGRIISKIVYALDDAFWFVVPGRGVARFDRRGGPWWIYGQESGLPGSAAVSGIVRRANKSAWIATTSGLLTYDGSRFTPVAMPAAIRGHHVTALVMFPDQKLWVATGAPLSPAGIWERIPPGVGSQARWIRVVTIPSIDSDVAIQTMLRARNGDVWIGTVERTGNAGAGVFRFKDNAWRNYTVKDGVAANQVLSLAEDTAGGIWVGTPRGISRFDGSRWRSYGLKDGLKSRFAGALCAARDGSIWVGGNRPNSGVSRLAGGVWTHFTVDSGLANDDVWSIVEAENGAIWVGTARGVSCYKENQWFTHRAENGLANDQVWAAASLGDGALLFGHFDGGVSKFHVTSTEGPKSFIGTLPARVAYPGFLTIGWWGTDRLGRTRQADLLYSWCLDSRPMTRFAASTSHTFVSLTPGTHIFTVKTIDQEGNSDGTQVSASFTVDAPFWQTLWFILPTAIGTIGIAIAGSIAYRRNRQWKRAQAQLVGEMERELQVAQRLQNELLPQSDPVIPGLEITGTCMAASRVGGDYFTYLWSDNEHQRIGVVIADVTGHAMQAAIPAVLFSGMLATASRQTERPGVILRILNEALVTRVGANTFICCTIAVFDVEKSQLTLANAGGLDPVRLSDGVTEPVCVSGNRLPLGVVPDLDYSECEVTLSPGDLVVFVSDGIVEAKSPTGELFGFARVADGANRWKTAADARQGLLNEVSSFMEARDQDDDITVIAVRVLDDPARVET